jgi:acyl carrier protein
MKETKMSVEERVKKIVIQQLKARKDEATSEARFVQDLGAESIDSIELMAAFEVEFDIEFLCVGTLARFKEKKAEIFMSYLCNGDKGHFEIPSPELARIRKKEAEESAKILGAEIQGGMFPDLDIYPDKEARKKVVDLIRVARPDLVITHSPEDYMCDHTTTSKLVIDASFIAQSINPIL